MKATNTDYIRKNFEIIESSAERIMSFIDDLIHEDDNYLEEIEEKKKACETIKVALIKDKIQYSFDSYGDGTGSFSINGPCNPFTIHFRDRRRVEYHWDFFTTWKPVICMLEKATKLKSRISYESMPDCGYIISVDYSLLSNSEDDDVFAENVMFNKLLFQKDIKVIIKTIFKNKKRMSRKDDE